MIFLIEYNRLKGQLVDFQQFDDSKRQEAKELRFKRELELHQSGVEHEVVLLEAENEETIRKTHSRYFESLEELLKSAVDVFKS